MTENASSPHSPDGADSIGRNTLSALGVQFTTAAFTAALTLFLVRALGPAEYGLFALAVGIGALLLLPSDSGISQSASRFIAEHRGDRPSVAAVMADAFRLKLVVAAVVSVALFVAASPIAAAYDNAALVWPLRGIAVALFGQSLMLLLGGSFVAMGRVAVNLRIIFSESAVETGASIALVLLGAGATGAAFGRAVGYTAGALVAAAMVARALGRPALRLSGRTHGRLRQMAGYAGALFVIDGAFTLFNNIDILVIGAIIGSGAVGLFYAPLKLITFLHYPGLAASAAVSPRQARHKEHGPDTGAFKSAIRYVMILQAALLAPVIVWAGPITELLLGPKYSESADVLRALAPFVFLSGLAPLVSMSVNYLGEARRRIPIAIAAVLINFGIDVAYIPKIGIVAGAIGTDIAYALYVPAHFWICKRMLGIALRPVIVTLVRSMAGAAAMAAVLLVAGTSDLSLLAWVVGGVGGILAYCIALLVTGEVSLGELRTARRGLSSRLPRPAR